MFNFLSAKFTLKRLFFLDIPLANGKIIGLYRLGPVAQLGARVNRTDEVAGSNPARSIEDYPQILEIGQIEKLKKSVKSAKSVDEIVVKSLALNNGGLWRSWERVSMALRRSWVRVPLGPLDL